MRNLSFLLLLLAAAPPPSRTGAATPASGEILISVSDLTSRLRPAVAADRKGRFLVAWREIAGADGGVAGRPLSAAGAPAGPGFLIEPGEADLHTTDPVITPAADGAFLVAWGAGVFPRPGCARARVVGADGPSGDVFALAPCANENGRAPAVALAGLPDGRFTAAWEEGQSTTPDGFDVFVRPFAAPGKPLDEPLRADREDDGSGGIGDQTAPAVAVDAAGRAVVLWHDNRSGILRGRRFDAAGNPRGMPFRVDGGTGFPIEAAVASSPGGRFIAVWSAFTGQGTRIYAQLFDAKGRKQGMPVPVSPPAPPPGQRGAEDPDLAMDAAGHFVVVWDAGQVDGSGTGILGRLFDAGGVPQGAPFRINVTGPGAQAHPAVAFARDGRFLVVWESQKNAGARGAIVGRLYTTSWPVVP